MALRNIMNYQLDDVLRKKSRPVNQLDDRTLLLLEDMAETMNASHGTGLAAVQVGILRRIIVIDDGNGLIKLINPIIVESSGEQQEFEGCLSIPGKYGKVNRPKKVVVKALNESGQSVILEGTGLLARAFCHEIDHMDGILFIDKVIPGSIINKCDLESDDSQEDEYQLK